MKKIAFLVSMALGAMALYSCSAPSAQIPLQKDTQRLELSGDVLSVRMISYKFPSPNLKVMNQIDPQGFNVYQEFNESGMMVLEQKYNPAGEVVNRRTMTYRNGNLLVELKEYGKDSVLYASTVNHFKGKALVKTEHFNADGTLKDYELHETTENPGEFKSTTYKNDTVTIYRIQKFQDDLIVSNTTYSAKNNKEFSSFKMKYDNNGRMVEMVSDNILFGKIVNTMVFDERGFRTKVTLTSERAKDPMISYFEYETDEHGNWIERRRYDGEEKTPSRIDRREIVYR